MRPRTKDRHLPARMYHRHGAYYYVYRGKWTRLGVELSIALQEYAVLTAGPGGGMVELIDRVLEEANVEPSTLKQYKIAAAKVKHAFEPLAPEQVRPTHVAEFMDFYRKTPNMANRCRSILKMAFDIAVRAGMRDNNPVPSIPPFKEAKRKRYVSDDEYHRLLVASKPALQSIIQLAYLTAQRIGDVLAIRMSDISDDGITFQQQKTEARLMVEMTPELRAAVDAAKALHGEVTRIYLLGQRNGRIRSYRGARDLFERAVQRAGLEDITLHDLRAKSLTDAKKQGLNPTALAGHTTEAQTVRYIRSRETAIVQGPSIGQSNKKHGHERRK